ncbi:15640_t:CDS:2 [Acaulospora morrowiae]|uniref:15640_t:CDS:1 n=1 Tax=Acaulospora morrowiae TaxID=94023 RepID=A0A9N8WQK2_9GLOM|nr:15640_t:CDS:2 [Acaulospora morrowiae]
MKSAAIIVLSVLFLATCAVGKLIPNIVKQVQVHEVLPSEVFVTRDGENRYTVESVWYGSGYEDDDKVDAILRCHAGVQVKTSPQHKVFADRRAFFELIVPQNLSTVVCRRGIFDIDSFRGAIFTFEHK